MGASATPALFIFNQKRLPFFVEVVSGVFVFVWLLGDQSRVSIITTALSEVNASYPLSLQLRGK